MPDKVRIALDAMGGDHGAAAILPGADISLTRHPDIECLLFGNRAAIDPVLEKLPRLKAKSKVVHTEVAIRMDDKPSQALRYGRWKSSKYRRADGNGALQSENEERDRAPGNCCVMANAEG
jgi:phosphate acyltransferase